MTDERAKSITVTIRLPAEMWDRIGRAAESEDRSRNSWVRRAVESEFRRIELATAFGEAAARAEGVDPSPDLNLPTPTVERISEQLDSGVRLPRPERTDP